MCVCVQFVPLSREFSFAGSRVRSGLAQISPIPAFNASQRNLQYPGRPPNSQATSTKQPAHKMTNHNKVFHTLTAARDQDPNWLATLTMSSSA